MEHGCTQVRCTDADLRSCEALDVDHRTVAHDQEPKVECHRGLHRQMVLDHIFSQRKPTSSQRMWNPAGCPREPPTKTKRGRRVVEGHSIVISAVKQCWHLKDAAWTGECLLRPRTCSVARSADELGLKGMAECVKTYFIKGSHISYPISSVRPPEYRKGSPNP